MLLNALFHPPARPIFVKNEKTEVKKDHCETIFRHSVMVDLEGADTVDPTDQAVQDELQAKRPDLYAHYYKVPDAEQSKQIFPKFVNDYRRYNFSIGGVVVTEAVFPCFARKRSTGNIEEYLLSQDYAMPRIFAPSGNERKVASRFVFRRDGQTNDTTLIAMVDKAVEAVFPINPKYSERSELGKHPRSRVNQLYSLS